MRIDLAQQNSVELRQNPRQSLDPGSLWRHSPKYVKLPREVFNDLIRRAQDQDPKAIEEIVRRNIRLVYSMARRYPSPNLTFEDLVQEGSHGLLVAVKKFDVSRGWKFSTLAGWWIQQAIRRKTVQSKLIPIPEGRIGRLAKIQHAERMLEAKGRAIDDAAIASETGIPLDKVLELRSTPMTRAVQVANSAALVTECATGYETDPMKTVEVREGREFTRQAFAQLTSDEQRIVAAFFGLGQEKVGSYRALGEYLGLTTEKARGELTRVLQKMRRYLKSQGYTWSGRNYDVRCLS